MSEEGEWTDEDQGQDSEEKEEDDYEDEPEEEQFSETGHEEAEVAKDDDKDDPLIVIAPPQENVIEKEPEELIEIAVIYHSAEIATKKQVKVGKKRSLIDFLKAMKQQAPPEARFLLPEVFFKEKQLVVVHENCLQSLKISLKPVSIQPNIEVEVIEEINEKNSVYSEGSSSEEAKKKKKKKKPNKKKKRERKKTEEPKLEITPEDPPQAQEIDMSPFEHKEMTFMPESTSAEDLLGTAVDVLLDDPTGLSVVQTFRQAMREATLPSCHVFSADRPLSVRGLGLLPFTSRVAFTLKVAAGNGAFTYARVDLSGAVRGEPAAVWLDNALVLAAGQQVSVALLGEHPVEGAVCVLRNEQAVAIGSDGTNFAFLSAHKLPFSSIYYESAS